MISFFDPTKGKWIKFFSDEESLEDAIRTERDEFSLFRDEELFQQRRHKREEE